MLKENILKKGILLSFLILLLIAPLYFVKFSWNRTKSLEGSFFITFPLLRADVGDYALIEGHKTSYFPGKTFIKILKGKEGDIIEDKEDRIFIRGEYIGFTLSETIDGMSLHKIKERIVPQGYVFVAGTNPRSFDSRYEEFGLVPESKIMGKTLKVF